MPRKGKVVILLADEDDPLPTAQEHAALEFLFRHLTKTHQQEKKIQRRRKRPRGGSSQDTTHA